MGARSIYNYNTDPRVKAILDDVIPALAASVEEKYGVIGDTEQLKKVLEYFAIHGVVIIVKTIVDNVKTFILLHPEYDDVSINMEPTEKLTFSKYLPKSQKEERLVFSGDNFKIYEGSLADIKYRELLTFLGYSDSSVI